MKKFLLPLVAMVLGTAVSIANDHTLVFDGENDMYGLTRQTTIDAASLTFVPEFSFTEAGIDFSIKKTSETGEGFALVNAGDTNAGIYVYSALGQKTFITPVVTLKVPGGKITAVKLYMSGTLKNAGCSSLDVNFNDAPVESENAGTLYSWSWSNPEGTETVSFTWDNAYYGRFIHTIEVTYSEDLGDKKENGLAFSENVVEAVMGEEFTAPTLSNPNNLPLTWESSDVNVATVDADGKITLVGGGKTMITVSTEGNAEYAAGNTRYELTVIPSASNLVQMLAMAPAVYDRVEVNFPVTVTFASGNTAYLIDAEGNAGYLQDIRNQGSTSTVVITLYEVGNVIPAGWIATNATMYESVIWQGIPPEVTETVEVTYPEVTSVTPADAEKVVIIKEVTFAKSTASGNTKAYGTTPGGDTYEFQDTYNVPSKPAGVYDVTCIVKYSKVGTTEYFYLVPIAYEETSAIRTVEAAGAETRYYDLHGVEVKTPVNGIYVKVVGGEASKVFVK